MESESLEEKWIQGTATTHTIQANHEKYKLTQLLGPGNRTTKIKQTHFQPAETETKEADHSKA